MAHGSEGNNGAHSAVTFHRWLFDRVRLPWQARFLDLVCGMGVIWPKNQEHVPPQLTFCLLTFL
jgi:hypothetical protein